MKAIVAAFLYCGCHTGEVLKVDKSQVQLALQNLQDVAQRKRYIAFYADGEWIDPDNYISQKSDWEDHLNRKLEQQ